MKRVAGLAGWDFPPAGSPGLPGRAIRLQYGDLRAWWGPAVATQAAVQGRAG
jgi:hypothetical protein